jgi:hypothetical protein
VLKAPSSQSLSAGAGGQLIGIDDPVGEIADSPIGAGSSIAAFSH